MRRWIVWGAALCGLWWGSSALTAGQGQNPLERASWAPASFSGTVREVLAVGHYSYLRLETDGGAGEVWVVVMNEEHAPGRRVQAQTYAALDGFHSPKLGRDFDRLYFGAVGGPARWTR